MSVRKKNSKNPLKTLYAVMAILIVLLMMYGVKMILELDEKSRIFDVNVVNSVAQEQINIEYPTEEPTFPKIDYPDKADEITEFGDDIVSQAGVLINVTDNKIIAGRDAEKRIYPASMTKIMTLIVAVENMESLYDTFTMTYDILAPLVSADASRAGFVENETVMIEDMLYGAILPSGADATVGLAMAISGSEEAFVELMNQKCESLGLENTHFTNTSGLHDENHYTTPVEMAMITEYAMKNELCREILSTYQYTTSSTKDHPEGIKLESTMFGRMYGDEVEGATIEGGKTGFTDQAQSCLATFGTKNGKEYVTITSLSYSPWKSVYDAFNLYAYYIEPQTEINIRTE